MSAKYYLKAITTNNRDLRTSILFQIEESTYLFNCPDGFQRIALIQRMKFGKIKCFFLSSLHPDYFGGFPGFYLSTREQHSLINVHQFYINVYGPPGLRNYIKAAKSFIGPLYHINSLEISPNSQMVQLNAQPPAGQAMEEEKKEAPKLGRKKSYQSTLVRNHEDDKLRVEFVELTSSEKSKSPCYSFIGVPIQERGKFLPNKAKDLKCHPKLHYKLLSEGQQVTLEDGTIVYPFQVLEEPLPAKCFILMFIPSEDYVESLFLQENLDKFAPFYLENIDKKKLNVGVMYHSIPLNCLINPMYKDFMMKFGPKVQHVIDTHETNDEVMARAKGYNLHLKHKQVCPNLMPLSPLELKSFHANRQKVEGALKQIDFVHSQIGLVNNLNMGQRSGWDYSETITNQELFNDTETNSQNSVKQLVEALLQFQKESEAKDQPYYYDILQQNKSKFQFEPEILFLGTVSMKPTQYRAASAIYVKIGEQGILMDCAEGSYGQIYDHYQRKELVDEVMLQTRVVYITHLHGDHQLGVIKIIVERDRLLKQADPANKMFVVSPTPMLEWLESFKKDFLNFPEMLEIVSSDLLNPEQEKYYLDENDAEFKYQSYLLKRQGMTQQEKNAEPFQEEESKMQKPICKVKTAEESDKIIKSFQAPTEKVGELFGLLQTMGIEKMLSIETDHCIESYACLLDSPHWGRILYTGDTRPCQNVINYGQNVRLLIHEATFEDGLEQDAFDKKHATTGEALQVGQACNAWRTVLTHFSPRYQKIAEISEKHLEQKAMVAFDHMKIKLSQFEWTYRLLDVYRKIFTNEEEDKPQKKKEKAKK